MPAFETLAVMMVEPGCWAVATPFWSMVTMQAVCGVILQVTDLAADVVLAGAGAGVDAGGELAGGALREAGVGRSAGRRRAGGAAAVCGDGAAMALAVVVVAAGLQLEAGSVVQSVDGCAEHDAGDDGVDDRRGWGCWWRRRRWR